MFKLPALPYAKNALAPFLSEEQMTYHYEKHHKAYIDNLNKFLETDASLKGKSLEEIILSSSGGVFNNAAQAWNHTFFWNCMQTAQSSAPAGKLMEAITRDFGSLDALKEKFVDGGVKTFGSGWIWLCSDASGKLSLVSTSNAQVPFTNNGPVPVLVADVWEHAYYVDYRNLRAKFLETFWTRVNWKYVAETYDSRKVRDLTSSMKA